MGNTPEHEVKFGGYRVQVHSWFKALGKKFGTLAHKSASFSQARIYTSRSNARAIIQRHYLKGASLQSRNVRAALSSDGKHGFCQPQPSVLDLCAAKIPGDLCPRLIEGLAKRFERVRSERRSVNQSTCFHPCVPTPPPNMTMSGHNLIYVGNVHYGRDK